MPKVQIEVGFEETQYVTYEVEVPEGWAQPEDGDEAAVLALMDRGRELGREPGECSDWRIVNVTERKGAGT